MKNKRQGGILTVTNSAVHTTQLTSLPLGKHAPPFLSFSNPFPFPPPLSVTQTTHPLLSLSVSLSLRVYRHQSREKHSEINGTAIAHLQFRSKRNGDSIGIHRIHRQFHQHRFSVSPEASFY